MKLYTVTLSFQYVVVAKNKDHAVSVADEHLIDAFNDTGFGFFEKNIEEYESALGWTDDSFPYGGWSGLTIKDYEAD